MSRYSNAQRSIAPEPIEPFSDICARILADDDGATAEQALRMLLFDKRIGDAPLRGRVLATMRAIDLAVLPIHPRELVARSSVGVSPRLPTWLRDLRGYRRYTGDYGRRGEHVLVPHGPLQRASASKYQDYAENIYNRYRALTVAPAAFTHQDRVIPVSFELIDTDADRGVRAGGSPGAETIGFAPLAVEPGEIIAAPRWRGDKLFVEFQPAPSLDFDAQARAALRGLGAADCIIMPELALSPDHADALADLLANHSLPSPRILVAGSCLTRECEDELPWNESRIFNHAGVELWRQRKLWPAGLDAKQSTEYGLPEPPDGLALEYTACGSEIVLADIDSFGRCLVLICQDLHLTMVAGLLEAYQPDWIFVPILDRSIDPGRWAHGAAFGQSGKSQARYLAITSTCFGGPYDPAEPGGMGMAVGPRDIAAGTGDDLGRAISVVARPMPGNPRYAKVRWRSGAWLQTQLRATPPRKKR